MPQNIEIIYQSEKELIRDIDSMFQFVITISIFLLTMIDVLFSSFSTNTEESGLTLFKLAIIPISLVISYLIFKIFKYSFKIWVISATNILLFLEIILIVIFIATVMTTGNTVTTYSAYYTVKISSSGTMIIPIIILIFLIISSMFFRKVKS